MNRRDLHRILMVGTALAGGWPGWLRRAFGADAASARECHEPSGQAGERRWRQIVSTAYRRAQQAGKPLLVFVVPSVDEKTGRGYEAIWDRGRAFGELLNHGSDDALATLALAEVVCAPVAVVRGLVPSLDERSEPLMVLIETDAVPARVRALDGKLPSVPSRVDMIEEMGGVIPDYDALLDRHRKREQQGVQGRLQLLASLLDGGLRATPQMLLERAAQAQARQGLDAAGGPSGGAGPAELHRMAAVLLASAVGLPEGDRQRAVHQVAEAARFVLCRRRVPGSRWASSSGCGSEVEYEPGEERSNLIMACGMGHVPEQSQRFLDFLARDARWRS